MFHCIDNVLSDTTLAELEKYCQIRPNDKSSYDVWPPESTRNCTLPKCFTNDLGIQDRMMVLYDLYKHKELKDAKLRTASFAVQKIPPGACIPTHTDQCVMSLTVFLNRDPLLGGEFIFNDSIEITPKFNRGVYASFTKQEAGAPHQVNTVRGNVTRYTLQMFVWDKDAVEKGAKFP